MKYKASSSITVSYKARVIAQALHVMKRRQRQKRKNTQRGGQAEVEDEREGQREKGKRGTRGKD